MQIVLASNSPRRKQLLRLGGWEFIVVAAEVDERPLPAEAAPAYVLRLARDKAQASAGRVGPDGLIIAADTTVTDGTKILGKPSDPQEARRMLSSLRGHMHQVYTALALLRTADGTLLTDLCATDVPMREYSDKEMDAYIASGDPLDKAGAYAIQHAGFHPVDQLQGCYANVMGLPLCHLVRTLYRFGISPHADVPQACQAALEYACGIYPTILKLQ